MLPQADPPNAETLRFHRIVTEGDLTALRDTLTQGVDINAPGHVGNTALMLALEVRDLEKVKLLIERGADLELTNDFNSTPLRIAVGADFVEGVRLLLSLGAERGHHPKYPLKKIDYDFPLPDIPMMPELKAVMSEEEWKESQKNAQQSMRELGQNPSVEPMIRDVQSVEVLKLFLDAGDELSLAPAEVRRALVGLQTGGDPNCTPADYRRHKSPRFGARNPERMDYPFWQAMIRTGGHAYSARVKFNDNDPFEKPGPVWCFERFGSSLTQLADGRFVQIGGEHEDFYDPDFQIYNDVVVHDGRGGFEIYGYPRDSFPPTDFHSATLCQDGIYIIGSLGYVDQRQPGFTPVYRLTLDSWQFEPVRTTGEMPGWIHRHHARFESARNAIRIAGGELHLVDEKGEHQLVPNADRFELDLTQMKWWRVRE